MSGVLAPLVQTNSEELISVFSRCCHEKPLRGMCWLLWQPPAFALTLQPQEVEVWLCHRDGLRVLCLHNLGCERHNSWLQKAITGMGV